MTGGLLQLVAKGPDDIFLTNNPEITLFKTIYRRYSNFTIDEKILRFNKKAGFNSKSICRLRKYGDLLHKLTLIIDLPEIEMIYKSLTNSDVQSVLAQYGISWEYTSSPNAPVEQSQLPSIKIAISEQIIKLQTFIAFVNQNYLTSLTKLFNIYNSNAQSSEQYKSDPGIRFLENYISGINDGVNTYEGIAYNGMDITITPTILAEYNYSESYKLDNESTAMTVYNLGSVQQLTYNTFVDYVLDRQYISSQKGNIVGLTQNSLIVSGSFDNQFKNWLIKTGILLTRVGGYTESTSTLTTYGNFDYIPYSLDTYNLLNTPSTFISGTIANKVSMFSAQQALTSSVDNFYINWYCKINGLSDVFQVTNYDSANNTIILDADLSADTLIGENFYLTKSDVFGTITSVINGTTYSTLTLDSSSISATDGYYDNWYIVVGEESLLITNYVGSTYTCTTSGAWAVVPNVDDSFQLVTILNMGRSTVDNPILQITSSIFSDTSTYLGSYIYTNGQIFDIISNSENSTVSLQLNNTMIVPGIGQEISLFSSYVIGNVVQGVISSTISLKNSAINQTNGFYNNYYLYCDSELHQVLNYTVAHGIQTITLIDHMKTIPDTGTPFYLFQQINEIDNIYSATTNTVTVKTLLNLTANYYQGWYIYCNGDLIQISDSSGNLLSLASSWTANPSNGNICYIIQTLDENGTIVFAEEISTVTLDTTASSVDDFYDNWFILINNELKQVSSYTGSTKLATIIDNWTNVPNSENAYYLIKQFSDIGTISNIVGNKTANLTIDTHTTPAAGWFANCNGQLIEISAFQSATNTIELENQWTNIPEQNSLCYLYGTVNVDLSGIVNILPKNIITRIMPNDDADYTNYQIIVQHQLNTINYYNVGSGMCIMQKNWIYPLTGPDVGDECSLLPYGSFIPSESGILSGANYINVSDVYYGSAELQTSASSVNGAYVGWYIVITSNTTNTSYIFQITSYDGTNKIAELDSNWINGIPVAGDIYTLYSELPTNIVNTSIDNQQNNLATLDINADSVSSGFAGWLLSINGETSDIKYYDKTNRICVLQNEFRKEIASQSSYNLYNGLPEIGIIESKSDYVLQLQGSTLSTTNGYYNGSYLNLGLEMFLVDSYNGTTNNISIDGSGWTTIATLTSETQYRIFTIVDEVQKSLVSATASTAKISSSVSINYSGWYIFCNNQLIQITKSTFSSAFSQITLTLTSNWLNVPGNRSSYYLFESPVVSGYTIQIYPLGAVLHNDNLSFSDDQYNGWFIKTTDGSISEIQTYFGNNTLAVILETEPIVNVTPLVGSTYQLFSRLLNNIEISEIKNISSDGLTIQLAAQSSIIDNYYNGWYLQINKEVAQISSYTGSTGSAVIPIAYDKKPSIGSIYKLFNRILEDNLVFYNVLNLGVYSISISLLGLPVKQLFDYVINSGYNGSTTYIGLDAYNAYLSYFATSTNVANVVISYSLNFTQILTDLLSYILTNIKTNMLQLQQIFTTTQRNSLLDTHFIFAFYDVYVLNESNTYASVNNTFTNASTLTISNTGDNFTNNFAISSQGYYPTYVTNSLTAFNTFNTTYFNNSNYLNYFGNPSVWQVPGNPATLLLSTNDTAAPKNGMYVLNYVPLLVINDVPTLINSRLISYFSSNYPSYSSIYNTFITNLDNTLSNVETTLSNIIIPDIVFSTYDLTYLNNISTNTQKGTTDISLLGAFRPENTYDFIGYDSINYSNLSPLEFVVYKLLDEAVNFTQSYDFSGMVVDASSSIAINSELVIIIKNAATSFVTPSANLPSYATYTNNGYSLTAGDAQYLSNAISSIWFNIWNSLKQSYNQLFYNTLLSSTYFTNSLGYNMQNLLNQASDVMQINLNTYTNYYQLDTTTIPAINSMITDEINTFNGLFASYTKGNTILNIKNEIITPNTYYFSTFANIYDNGIVGTIKSGTTYASWLKSNQAYANTIINGTRNILSQYVECTMDIIGNISVLQNQFNNNLPITGDTIVGTFLKATAASSNPFSVSTQLYLWYNTYITDVSLVDFLNFMLNITPSTLFADSNNILSNYNGFSIETDIEQYVSDLIIKRTSINSLFGNVKNTWQLSYASLIAYFNTLLSTYNEYLIGIGINSDGTNQLYTQIYDAVTVQVANFAWIKYLGYYLIDSCFIDVGGCIIDSHTGEYLYLRNQLDNTLNQQIGINKMIGNVPELYTYNNIIKKGTTLYIPLEFWFCRNASHALPLVAMNYTDVVLGLNTKKIEDVAYWSQSAVFKKKPVMNCSIHAQYIYLEEDERKLISSFKHEQLIEVVQLNAVTMNGKSLQGDPSSIIQQKNTLIPYIYFGNMCKELIWTVRPTINIDGTLSINGVNLGERKWYEYRYYVETVNTSVSGKYSHIDASGNLLAGPDLQLLNEPVSLIVDCIDPYTSHNGLVSDSSGNVYDNSGNLVLPYEYKTEKYNSYKLQKTLTTTNDIYINPITDITINMNGNERENEKDFKFYTSVQPVTRHRTSLDNGIYAYSFALYPDLVQPSGAMNFSKVANFSLALVVNDQLVTDMLNKGIKIQCNMYGVTNVVLRIMSGMAGLAFYG